MASSSRAWGYWIAASPVLLGTFFTAAWGFTDDTRPNEAQAKKADKKVEKHQSSNVEVADALVEAANNEAIGDEKASNDRLDSLIKAHPDADTPRWLRGFMKTAD